MSKIPNNKSLKGFTLIEIVASVTLIMILFIFVSNMILSSFSNSINAARNINLIENAVVVEKFFENEIDSTATVEAVVTASKKIVKYEDFIGGDILTVFYSTKYINVDNLTNYYKVSAINFKKSSHEIWIHKYDTVFMDKSNLHVITSNVETLGNYEIANYVESIEMRRLDEKGNFSITIKMKDKDTTYSEDFTVYNSLDIY